jgi:hypothetical protein
VTAPCIILHKIGLTAGLALVLSIVASSSSFAYSARAQRMCMSDAMRLCSSEIPSVARITSCMRRNKASVSAGCRAVMDEMDGTAARAKPAERKPAAVARTDQPAAPRPAPKPVAAPVVAQPAIAETKPVEQKAPVISRAEEPAATRPVPAEQTLVTPPPAAQSASTETRPLQAAPAQQTPVLGSLAPIVVKAVQTASGEQVPAIAAPVEPPAATEATPPQNARVAETPAATAPVELPKAADKAVEAMPMQAAPVEQKPTLAAPVDVKPAATKSAAAAKPVQVVKRKQKQRQVYVAGYDRHGGDMDRAMAIALPMLSAILQSW